MTKMNLKQAGFTYRACGPFAKDKEKIQKLIKNRRCALYL